MKLENNWRQKNLEALEKDVWPSLNRDEDSYLINTCNSLRKKPLQDFTIEDLRIMISQEIGLPFLVSLAIEKLREDLFVGGDLYEGDLLKSVLDIDTRFWDNNQDYWEALNAILKDRYQEIVEMKIDTLKFRNSRPVK